MWPLPTKRPPPVPDDREGRDWKGGTGITAGPSQQATSPDERKMESGKCAALYLVSADPGHPAWWLQCQLVEKQFT